jgi:hypothetical protein
VAAARRGGRKVGSAWVQVVPGLPKDTIATGMYVVDAMNVMSAHAYLTGCRLSQVASDVIERRLRFEPDTDNTGAAGIGG